MQIKEFFNKALNFLTPQNIIILLAVSAFMPFVITAVCIGAALVLILFTPSLQKGLFCFRGAYLIPAFSLLAFILALINRNLTGALVAVLFFAIMVIYTFVRKNITQECFETSLTAICFMVYPSFVSAAAETFAAKLGDGVYRCVSFYANANYFGSMMAAIIIICAYKALNTPGKATLFYYVTAFFALINIYLSASLFAIIEFIVGIAIYLLFSKHYRLFCLMVILGSLAIIVITKTPQLLPRLSETSSATGYRVRIWGVAIKEISNYPLFGRGFLSYRLVNELYKGAYVTAHCHNIIIDSLLNFGIIGTAILVVLIYYIVRRIAFVWAKDTKSGVAAISLAIVSAILAHSFTDVTFMWIQTGLIYVIMLAAPAFEEKRLGLDKDSYIFKKYRI